jgi:hypothetical protein
MSVWQKKQMLSLRWTSHLKCDRLSEEYPCPEVQFQWWSDGKPFGVAYMIYFF